MKGGHSHRGTGLLACLGLVISLSLFAAARTFASYASVKAVLDAHPDLLPAELKNPNEAKWLSWSRRQDKAIRARLTQGDLDSMVNLLLLGTSFTKQPQVRMEGLAEAAKAGTLRTRVDDLVAGLRNPGNNERLIFLAGLLRSQGLDPNSDGPEPGPFLYKNIQRVIEERRALAERAAQVQATARSSLFRDRGVSLDTSLFPDFSIDLCLRDLKQRGVLAEGQVTRVAVIGPGLDFIDKNEDSAFDFYPQQTVQPFALYDSLVRLGLAKPGALSVSILDISSRVVEHLQRARQRAGKRQDYVIQLPREAARPWPPELIAYWRTLGDRVGRTVEPIRPPAIFRGVETRAVSVRPDVVSALEPVDLDVVLERLNLAEAERFDLIIGTNVFVYYDPFAQSLALENIAAMLKPGALLLTNDNLPEVPGGSMKLDGATIVPYDIAGTGGREGVGWYRKK